MLVMIILRAATGTNWETLEQSQDWVWGEGSGQSGGVSEVDATGIASSSITEGDQ